MSIKYLNQAWAIELPTATKIVLLSLADQANDAGICWPGIASIAKRTGLTERSVYKQLAKLESQGHISRKTRRGHSSFFVLHMTKFVLQNDLTPEPNSGLPLNYVQVTPEPRSGITIIEPSI